LPRHLSWRKMVNQIDKVKYPYVHSGFQYALDIVSGEIPSCIYIFGACERFLKDFESCKLATYVYWFDIDRAERYLRLVQKFEHVKGQWETPNIIYLPWQNFAFMNIQGFRHRGSNFPRFRTAHIEVPRGQGKSAMASQAVLFDVGLDNPKGNEVSCVATKTDQARIVLDSARAMAKANAKFLKSTGIEVLAHKIVHDASNSFVRALSSDDKSLDGLNDKLAVCDELHAMSRELFEVVYSGMSKRRDSLLLCITTAGFSTDSIGYTQSVYAKKVAKGEMKDEQFFSMVYTIDEGDDIFDESSWRKANPSYGHSVDPITFEAKAMKAKETPSDIPNFKVKHLNIWISEANAFFDLAAWDKCCDPTITLEQFFGQRCFVGIDLASKVDLTSFGYIFHKDGKYYLFDKTYIPEATVSQVRNALYDNSIAGGFLIQTAGEAIHYPTLRADFVALSKKVKIINALYDPWNAVSFAQECQNDRIEMVEYRMNTANLSEATKNFDALIRQGKIVHNGSPLIRWCLGNVVAKEDAAGNVFPKKSHEKLKIDPIISFIMAIAAWTQEDTSPSVYETRGVRFL
jgi:phage terminase large subunit-like protein